MNDKQRWWKGLVKHEWTMLIHSVRSGVKALQHWVDSDSCCLSFLFLIPFDDKQPVAENYQTGHRFEDHPKKVPSSAASEFIYIKLHLL